MSDYLPFVNVDPSSVPIEIHAGLVHVCSLLFNNEIKCWGNGFQGSLGSGNTQDIGNDPNELGSYLLPINLGSGFIVQQLAVGGYHNLVMSETNKIKAWGRSNGGQLGYGTVNTRGESASEMGDYLPFIQTGSGIIPINLKAQSDNSCLHFDSLEVKCWGNSMWGILGNGQVAESIGDEPSELGDYLPTIEFPIGVDVDSMDGGWYHMGMIGSNGKLYMWGDGTAGRLGIGSTISIGDNPSEMGTYLLNTDLGSGRSPILISGGQEHTCGILDNFDLKCWGSAATYGQLGYGDTQDRGDVGGEMGNSLPPVSLGTNLKAESIHLGSYHSCVVLNDDSIKCFGANSSGQLGKGHTTHLGKASGEMGVYLGSINLGSGIEVKLCYDYSPSSSPSISLNPTYYDPSPCSSRFTFDHHNCLLSSFQKVKCFGLNFYGGLGYGDVIYRGDDPNEMGNDLPHVNVGDSVISVHGGHEFECVLLTTLSVKCWGDGFYGSLGYGDPNHRGDAVSEMGNYLPTIDFGSNVTVVELNVGYRHNSIKTDTGKIKSWGDNPQGGLGYGDMVRRGDSVGEMGNYLPYLNLGTGALVFQIKNAEEYSCVLLADFNVKCYGWANVGQLGNGNTNNVGDASSEMGDYLIPASFPSGITVSTIGVGNSQTGMITTDRSLFTWGKNDKGQLGQGILNNIGDAPSEMGDYMRSIQLGSGRTALEFSGGFDHSCVLLDNYEMKCFGDNQFGQLGYGDTTDRGGTIIQMGNYLPNVHVGSGLWVQSLHIGRSHSCAFLSNDEYECWGRANNGQLGYEDISNVGDNLNELGDYLLSVDLGTGFNIQLCFDYSPTYSPSFNPTTPNPTISPSLNPTIFIKPDCSSEFSNGNFNCILSINFQVKCFGDNSNEGRLGYGDVSNRGGLPNQMSDYLPYLNLGGNVIGMKLGDQFSCVQLFTLDVKCWGSNSSGQLGYGDTQDRGDNANEMGEYLPTINFGSGLIIDSFSVSNSHALMLTASGKVKAWGDNTNGKV